MENKKIYKFFNDGHIGDCLISLNFLKKLAKENDIICEFSCNMDYIQSSIYQLLEFVEDEPRIQIVNMPVEGYIWDHSKIYRASDGAINLWYPVILNRITNEKETWQNDIFKMWFHIGNQIAKELNLKNPFKNIEDVVFYANAFKDSALYNEDNSIAKFDFLIINSYCVSGQIKLTWEEQDNLFESIIKILIQNNKTFITTKKIKEYDCTLDYGLSLVKIGQIAKDSRFIIGVPTSPYLIAINELNYKNCEFINISSEIDNLFFNLNDKFFNFDPQKDKEKLMNKINDLVKSLKE